MTVVARDDVRWVAIVPWSEVDGGLSYMIGHDGVTAIKIVARHGPMDWLPYVEVWQGDRLYAEVPQHQTLTVEFKPASAIEARSDATGTGAAEGESAAAESRDAHNSSAELYFSKGGVK